MILGIVGSNAAKFTAETERLARARIVLLLSGLGPLDACCSGHCPEGGIDIWMEEEADRLGVSKIIHPPSVLKWEGTKKNPGYHQRNMQIAETSTKVVCITVRQLPPEYDGMRFHRCYHHDDEATVPDHVKSGGCWTTKYARSIGKETELIII